MSIDGTWNTVTKSPIGEQKSVMTLTADGNTFSGTSSNPMMGEAPIESGVIEGDAVRWTMKVAKPMPMTIEGAATLSGDTLEGTVKAGMMGSWPFSATRA
jgi:hypothetical protein